MHFITTLTTKDVKEKYEQFIYTHAYIESNLFVGFDSSFDVSKRLFL